jgi:hypothetical protein
MAESTYPEHDKMAAMRTEIDAVADFLEKLEAGELLYGHRAGIHLAIDCDSGNPHSHAIPVNIPELLAQWSGIDQNKIETEKREMLRKCQEMASRS